MNELKIRNIDHLGVIAGIVDQIGLVEIVNAEIGENSQQKISAGISLFYQRRRVIIKKKP